MGKLLGFNISVVRTESKTDVKVEFSCKIPKNSEKISELEKNLKNFLEIF